METLPKPSREYWWLIGLEATLFFSLPCWENTARWSRPAANPLQFTAFVISAATIAMLCCHIGPAMFAAKFGARPHLAWWIPAIWLSAGYLEWLGTVRTLGPHVYWPHILRRPIEIALVFAVLAVITLVAWIGPAWKYAGVACLAFSIGVLTWCTATSWPGLWVDNPHFDFAGEPAAHDWLLVKGMLLSAAPAFLIGWRLGRVESRPFQVWMSGILGLWLPIVVSVTLASLAAMAGVRAHYRPSLPGGFYWAMQGSHGRLEPSAIVLVSLTFLGPALLAAVCLNEFARQSVRRPKPWLVILSVCLLSYGLSFAQLLWPQGFGSIFLNPAHEIWAWSLVVLGAAAGAACILLPRSWAHSP